MAKPSNLQCMLASNGISYKLTYTELTLSLSLSLSAGVYWMTEAVVTTGAINRAKLQSNHHHQQTNAQFFYRPDALPVAQPTVSKH